MIEQGRVVAVEPDAYWVETISSSSCGNCVAQKGCGQGLLSEYFEGRSNHMRVLKGANNATEFVLEDLIEFEVADRVLLSSAFIVYTLPLISMLSLAALADYYFLHAAAAPLGALAGFVLGFLPARLINGKMRNNLSLQPLVTGRVASVAIEPVSA